MVFLHIHLDELFFHQVAIGVGFFDRIEENVVIGVGNSDDAMAAPAILVVFEFGPEVIHQHVGGGFLEPLYHGFRIAEVAEANLSFWIDTMGFVVSQTFLQVVFLSGFGVWRMIPADDRFCHVMQGILYDYGVVQDENIL